jgi:hypothetical protein
MTNFCEKFTVRFNRRSEIADATLQIERSDAGAHKHPHPSTFVRRRFDTSVTSVNRNFCALLSTIPHRPDGRPSPARAETAAVVAPTVEPRIAYIVSPAVVSVMWGVGRTVADRSLRTINRSANVGRLMIAGQKAIAVPMVDVPTVSGRGECEGWEQRQQHCTR